MVLLYLREDKVAVDFEQQYSILEEENLALISIVTKAELLALALKNNWGNRRINQLEQFLEQFFIIDIAAEDILQEYARIDAFREQVTNNLPILTRSFSF